MKWVTFTRRTDGPKLRWLRCQLNRAGIRNRLNGWTFHAPILQVPEEDLERAWEFLPPMIDEAADDHMAFEITEATPLMIMAGLS